MEVISRELVMLQTTDGKVPFEEWLSSTKSKSFESTQNKDIKKAQTLFKEYLSAK